MERESYSGFPFKIRHAAQRAAATRTASATLPTKRSVRVERGRWGEEDGNRVDVWSADGEVSTVTARVDVRRLDSKFGAALLAFVRAIGAVLIRQDGLVVQPTINAYSGALRSSTAMRAVFGNSSRGNGAKCGEGSASARRADVPEIVEQSRASDE